MSSTASEATTDRKLDWHVRNPTAGQWKDLFTPNLLAAFNERYGSLLEKYGY